MEGESLGRKKDTLQAERRLRDRRLILLLRHGRGVARGDLSRGEAAAGREPGLI